ncbi:MAG: Rrf2 family transcriptional regulator [Clostridia bacterium]|nr:Rrf2 family transcriptional regulator [Clostridia bacterium]
MKLSTKGHYGLKAIFDLALHSKTKEPIPLKIIAQRQNLSEYYLEQLFATLRKAGLVKSVRGASGGYLLAREPAEIRVGDIIRALEGPIDLVECVSESGEPDCGNAGNCITRSVLARVRDSITEVLDSTTLEDMCREAQEVNR